MKKQFRASLCLLLAVLLCLPMALTSCGSPAYRVTVKDALGNPYTSGVVVKFMKDGQPAGMQVVDENGVAEKELEPGDYTVELSFTSDDVTYHYDTGDLTLSDSRRELTVELAQAVSGDPTSLMAETQSHDAYGVSTGCTYVTLKKGERNYFLFTPTVAGKYEFSLPGSTATLGYYGAPHYVQSLNMAEPEDGKFFVSVKASMIGTNGTGTTTLVLGVDAGDNENCVLAIQRIGEPDRTIEDEPWNVYQKTVTLNKYTLPAGAKLSEFDLTAATYKLVLNDKDGFYHLNTADGPLVLMRLGKKSQYLDDFKTILEHSGVVKYFFDENENFVKKESYSECLLEYIGQMDEDAGVYPLTEDLKYIVQQRADHSGWFDPEDSLYLFKDAAGNNIAGINPDNCWLFMCCYIGA